MSTNSTITMVHENGGSVTSIYVHSDGDTNSVGAILKEHYTAPEKIAALMRLGNLSSLGPELGVKHDFNKPDPAVCNAYKRDRGERGQSAQRYETLTEFMINSCSQQYNYLFENGEWVMSKYSRGFEEF